MERRGRLVATITGWKCPVCDVYVSFERESVAVAVHQTFSPGCLLDSPLDEAQQIASASGSEHLESDDAVLAIHMGAQFSQRTSEADLWPASRWSDEMMVSEVLQRTAASREHPNFLPQPPGRSKDEESADSGQELESRDVVYRRDIPREGERRDDVVYLRDIPREGERRDAPDEQLTRSRIEQAKGAIKQLRCTVCLVNWRSNTTTLCRHFGCCQPCLQQTNGICVVCRERVESSFPVEFHSSKLLEGLDIPYLLTAILLEDQLQVLLDMKRFPESKLRRAIYLIQRQNNTEEQPDLDSVFDFMASNPTLIGLPLAEEMDLLLDDANLDDKVKSRLCDYLEAISACMACRCRSPSICLIPCSHLTVCRECFDRQPRPQECPDCGKQIDNQVDVYLP